MTVEELRAEQARVAARLEAAVTAADRDEVKASIVALYQRVDQALGDLTAVREAVRALVDRWKLLAADAAGESPAPTATAPVRTDHLGASTYLEKGWSLIALGDHPGAVAALRRALDLAPGDLQAEALLGWALMLDDRQDEALGAFSRVLQRDPDNALARVNLGYVCFKKRIFGEAIEHLSRVLREDRDRKASLYANYYLGLVYQERGMFADATRFFRQALALGPNLHEAAYELGRALWFGGDGEAARATWRAAAIAGRDSPWARRAAALLAQVDAGGEVPRSRPS